MNRVFSQTAARQQAPFLRHHKMVVQKGRFPVANIAARCIGLCTALPCPAQHAASAIAPHHIFLLCLPAICLTCFSGTKGRWQRLPHTPLSDITQKRPMVLPAFISVARNGKAAGEQQTGKRLASFCKPLSCSLLCQCHFTSPMALWYSCHKASTPFSGLLPSTCFMAASHDQVSSSAAERLNLRRKSLSFVC